MTALVDRTLVTDRVARATNEIAAADHLPLREAHDLVHITAPLGTAAKLRQIVADTHHTVRTQNGCQKVVPAPELLRIATELEDAADADLADLLDTAHLDAQAAASGLWAEEDPQITHLKAQVETLSRQLGTVIDAIVDQHLIRCDYIGEHPLNPAQRAAKEADVRAAWAAIALQGGA